MSRITLYTGNIYEIALKVLACGDLRRDHPAEARLSRMRGNTPLNTHTFAVIRQSSETRDTCTCGKSDSRYDMVASSYASGDRERYKLVSPAAGYYHRRSMRC